MNNYTVFNVFAQCVEAISKKVLIIKVSNTDKEFHFQNWFQKRLEVLSLNFDRNGRNLYPDFTLVNFTEGYEIKGLAYPGREANFDSNSQIPTGFHNGRTIFYVFGRYPANPDLVENEYPVIDLVICHGDFLNADHNYTHKNKHVNGFGSYGDIMIRDRKMYVVPTPFAIAKGFTGTQTLVVPKEYHAPNGFKKVGDLIRTEAKTLVVGYKFNLLEQKIETKTAKNKHAGKKHHFIAYRLKNGPDNKVEINPKNQKLIVTGDE